MNAQDFPTTELPWRAELLIWFGLIWQDWLYGDGEDATKSIYFGRLDDLRKVSLPPLSLSLSLSLSHTHTHKLSLSLPNTRTHEHKHGSWLPHVDRRIRTPAPGGTAPSPRRASTSAASTTSTRSSLSHSLTHTLSLSPTHSLLLSLPHTHSLSLSNPHGSWLPPVGHEFDRR